MGDTNLGGRLKEAREQSHLTQAEVCEKIGVSKPQTISSYERGTNNPTLETLKELSQLYSVSTDWLLFGREHSAQNVDLKTFLRFFTEQSEKFFEIKPLNCIEAFQPLEKIEWLDSDYMKSAGITKYTYSFIPRFFESWNNFLELRNSGALKPELYSLCINSLIDEYAPHLQKIINAAHDNKLPF